MNRSILISLAKRIARLTSPNEFAPPRLDKSVTNALDVCRGERVRPRVAALALAGLLLGQTFVPCGLLLSSVHAEELRIKNQKSAVQSSKAAIPAWATALEKRAAQQPRRPDARLAGFNRAGADGKNDGAPAEDLDCLDCEVDMKPLDLSDVPTEKALRRAGAGDGPLFPMRRGDAGELGVKLDRLLKRWNIEGGLSAELPPKDPRFKALTRGKERYERARAINMLFGRAVKQWRGEERAGAIELFGQYMEKYPRSPWSGEAALHLSYAAKNEGRLLDAIDMLREVLEKTSDKPNKKLRQAKRERNARGGEITDAEREADIDKAMQGAASVEEAVEKLDSAGASTDDDESFEIHMKAKQQLADIDMAMGHYNDAAGKLSEIMEEDTDWHRRVWARKQLQRTNLLKQDGGLQLSCGPQALGMVLVGLDKDAAAEKVKEVVAPNERGFSMAELQKLAAKNGVKMRGFRADTGQLSQLALPAILHYDYGSDAQGKVSGHFVTLQGVDSQSEMVRVFDPLSKKSVRLSYAQMKRQWSGQGLAVATVGARQVGAALDTRAMQAAIGSSTTFGIDHDMGETENNVDVGVGNGTDAPSVQVNQASFNVYAQHTLISYQPARGPAVDITAVYNSDFNSYNRGSLGERWRLNYDTYAERGGISDPNGSGHLVQSVTIEMPDGSTKLYWQNWRDGRVDAIYRGVKGDFNTVEVDSQGVAILIFPDGSRWTYAGYSGKLVQITDRFGLSLNFYYNSNNGTLGAIVDAEGKTTTLVYWPRGSGSSRYNVAKITDPFERVANLEYSYSGDLLRKVTDIASRVYSYAYEANTKDLSAIDTPKTVATQTPWLINREIPYANSTRVTVTNPVGDKEAFSFEPYNSLWFHTTPNRYTTPYNPFGSWQTHRSFGVNVDGESVPLRVAYADGTITTYRYERQHGLVDQITDRQGQITKFFYNYRGRVERVIDPKNIETSIEYSADGFDPKVFVQPNPAGTANIVAQTIDYNNYHQPISVTDVGGTTTYTYNSFGSLLTTTDPQQRVSRNVYDSAGRLSTVENSDGPITGPYQFVPAAGFTYDSKGRVQEVTDAANLTTTYEYDDLDNVTAIVHPDPDINKRREEILYLNGDLPVRVKDRFGRFSYTEYDALKRARKSYVQDPQNGAAVGTTQMDYDKNDNLTQLTDTKGNITRWNYDTLDRSISKTFHDGTSENYNYQYLAANTAPTTLTGRLASMTGKRGQNITYEYDENGNQTKTDYPYMPDVTMSYNALNDVWRITDNIGTHTLSYDDYGRLISNDGPQAGDTQTYSYDELERIQTQTLERGASGGVQSQTYNYDALGRLASLNSNGAHGAGLTTYSYDGNTDRLRILTHPNGTKSDLRYDALGRLQDVLNGANGDPLYNRYNSVYDARDVKLYTHSRTGSNDPLRVTNYSYDALDQLKQERVTGGAPGTAYTTNYDYDAMGNRTQVDKTSVAANGTSSVATTTSVPNTLNQLSSLTTTLSNGPTTSATLSYDPAGNLTRALNNGTRTVYTYDDLARLSVIEQRNAADVPLSKSQFVYDYANRRAISREFSYANGTWTQTDEKRRIFDGLDVIQERNAANQVTAQLVRDGNIGGILSRTTAQGPAFYAYDDKGNVTLLTNAAGQDVGHYRYDAFGNTLEAVGVRAGENPYRFSTKELHGPSGLYDYGFRFYSPGMGRWMNRDPLEEAGGVNLYAMVGNNPVNSTDAYGLKDNRPCKSDGIPGSCGPGKPKPPTPKPPTPKPAPAPTPPTPNKGKPTVSSAPKSGSNYKSSAVAVVAGGLTLVDGPLPIGDIIAGLIVGGALLYNGYQSLNGSRVYATSPTVNDVLQGKKGSIKNAPLPKGSPSWGEVGGKTMEEIENAARAGKTGYRTIKKLLTDKRFNK